MSARADQDKGEHETLNTRREEDDTGWGGHPVQTGRKRVKAGGSKDIRSRKSSK